MAGADVAFAGIIAPTTVYPSVPTDPNVCQAERLAVQQAQAAYDTAVTNYNRDLRLYNQRAVAAATLRATERTMHLAGISLNNAKYTEAKCQNNNGNDPDKVCIDLALELNRMLDELPLRQQLEQLADADYLMARTLAQSNAISAEELAAYRLAYETAVSNRQQLEARIQQQRTTIANTPACVNYQSERPAPEPTPTSSTTTPAPRAGVKVVIGCCEFT